MKITAATARAAEETAKEKGGNLLPPEKERQLKKACADFEALFAYELFKTMRRTIPPGGLLPKSVKNDSWEMIMDQHVAEELSKRNGGLGLQKILYEHAVRSLGPHKSAK
ncbi:MAG: rod-binding protein [Pseudomonadota bacterium]|nr:rod-binding protein [Pseudomonadota bacterium]